MSPLRAICLCAVFIAVPIALQRWVIGPSVRSQMDRSIDCINNHREMRVEICSVPEWAQLNAQIEQAYAEAQARYEGMPQTLAALQTTHQQALDVRMDRPFFQQSMQEWDGVGRPRGFTVRDAAQLASDIDAPERAMRRHLNFLHSLDGPRDGLGGRWVTPDAEIVVGQAGVASVTFARAGPRSERCTLRAQLSVLGGRAIISDPARAADPPLAGWSLQLERFGGLMRVTERAPAGRSAANTPIRPFCGGAAPLAGDYFPARARLWPF